MRARVIGLVGVLFVAGCSGPSPAGPSSPSSGAATVAGVGGRYAASGDLCQVADLSPIAALLPVVKDPKSTSDDRQYFRSLSCTATLSNERDMGTFEFELTLYHDGGLARDQFEGIRSATEAFATVTDVPALGQGAYRYVDSLFPGPNIKAYDGTLYLSIAWHPSRTTSAAGVGGRRTSS